MIHVMRMSRRAGGAFLAAGLLPAVVVAATIHVPADQPTIAAGMAAAAAGDTVIVACGTYREHDVAYRSGVVLRSESGSADCVTIDAEQLGRALDCRGAADVSIVGLTLGEGRHRLGGGGVYFESDQPGSRLTLTRCRFAGNAAVGWDGAALNVHGNQGASVAITDCAFADNDAGTGVARSS